MRVVIAGGTGFIGAPLCEALTRRGHEVTVVTRAPGRHPRAGEAREVSWDTDEWTRALGRAQGLINLAGESIAARRWTRSRKRLLQASRLETTRRLIEALRPLPARPAVLINASAVGYYGDRGDEILGESSPPGRGFLAETCVAWEMEAQRAEALGVRVVRLRMGVVLGPDGGALAQMVPPFRLGLGGPLGGGRQWVSWIHREDVIRLIEWALTHPALNGALNATAPQPVTMRQLAHALGRALHRPACLPVPAIGLRVLLGEMATVLLASQRVLPEAAQRTGYPFQFPELSAALERCLRHTRQ